MDPTYEMLINIYFAGCAVNCGISTLGMIDSWISCQKVRTTRNEQTRLQEKRGNFYFRSLKRTLIWPYDWHKNAYYALKWCVKK